MHIVDVVVVVVVVVLFVIGGWKIWYNRCGCRCRATG